MIEFSDEATSTMQRVIGSLHGYVAQITPLNGDEPFDAEIISAANHDGMTDGIQVRRWDNEQGGIGKAFTLRFSKILVY